jgi:hypothetical protein
MGKKKIAETLARAGLHLGVTTVGRILKEKPQPTTTPTADKASDSEQSTAGTEEATEQTVRTVTAKYPNRVWHVDLTTVSILG